MHSTWKRAGGRRNEKIAALASATNVSYLSLVVLQHRGCWCSNKWKCYEEPSLIITMKFQSAAVLLLASSTAAFAPSSLGNRARTVARSMATDVDLSIPYDAAARLAYDEWCSKYEKEPDETRYENFKINYETITVANVVSKKEARESGTETGPLLTLNEFGDFSATEFEEYEKSGEQPKTMSTGNVLDQAVESAQSQAEASSALQDAADALAEEEEVGLLSFDRAYCAT